jgi:hypothetical protein
MSKLMMALGSMGMGASKKKCCPDCGGELMMDGGCVDCGYGEDMGGMDDGEEEDEQMETQTLLDLKKQLQSAMELVDRLIVNNCD